MKKVISKLILFIPLIYLLSCSRDILMTAVTINGEPYEEKINNVITGPYPVKYLTFFNSNNWGIYTSILSPIDKNKPTYGLFIYLLGTGEDFIKGKNFKIGTPIDIESLFNTTLNDISNLSNIDKFVPTGYNGIAFFCEVYENEYLNPTGLAGSIDVFNYINQTETYECKYSFESKTDPNITFLNGYFKSVKINIK